MWTYKDDNAMCILSALPISFFRIPLTTLGTAEVNHSPAFFVPNFVRDVVTLQLDMNFAACFGIGVNYRSCKYQSCKWENMQPMRQH